MRLERGQKPKVRRFQGPKAPLTRMQENSKELKRNLEKRCNHLTEIAFPIYCRANRGDCVLVQEMPDAREEHRNAEAVGGGDDVVIAD
jgi:hypothetical protein